MKILAFGDVHGSDEALDELRQQAIEHKPDIMVCVGDFTIFGMDMFVIIEQLNLIAEMIDTKLVLIHGNHEDEDSVAELLEDYERIIYVHGDVFEFGDLCFVGFGGGGFSEHDPDFVAFIQSHIEYFQKRKHKLVLLTHQPPYGTRLDKIRGRYTGNSDFTEFIRNYKPVLALSGHIHETFGEQDEIGDTKLLNPGPGGVIIQL
jgi:uncharacterized protein